MADPTTSNQLFAVPTRGSDPGTWDLPVNSNTSANDGLFSGVQGISVSNASFSLTAPVGVVTPSAGPTQAQNAVIRFAGTVTAVISVTLPLPGYYIIDNSATIYSAAGFVLNLRAVGAGATIGLESGSVRHVYNDGTNVKFVNLSSIGTIEMWAGYSVLPLWVTNCTNLPYLLCDGTIYNIATYPVLGTRLGSSFGGNGVTTFGVPDLRGRVPIPYDGTGTRITVAGCGINGQVLGAAQDKQTNVLITGNLPPYTPAGTAIFSSGNVAIPQQGFASSGAPVSSSFSQGSNNGSSTVLNVNVTGNVAFTGTPAAGQISTPVNNVQPAQVSGIAVIRAG